MTDHRTVPLTQVDRNPDQPRKHFDEDALRELADSIRENGLLEPVVVRQHPDHPDRFLLVMGERRWRASHLAETGNIDVVIRDLDEVTAFKQSVAENINRADMTVMEEADSFEVLRGYGESVADIARTFGKSTTYVETRLSFLLLTTELRAMVEKGQMGPWLARYVAKLQPGNQRVVANRWARGEFDHETAASEFAAALHAAEQEVGFFEMEEPTEEERVEHAKKTKAAKSMLDGIERLSALLGDLAASDPADLADALGNDVARRLASIERITRQATTAHLNLRKAKAHAEARTLTVSKGVKG